MFKKRIKLLFLSGIVFMSSCLPCFNLNLCSEAYNPVGMKNIGNSCYLNSVLQQLYRIPRFHRFIISAEQINKETQPVLFALNGLFKEMDRREREASQEKRIAIIDPTEFIKILGNEIYNGSQLDSNEALCKIIDKLKNELDSESRAIINREFDIDMINQVNCHTCGTQEIIENGEAILRLKVTSRLEESVTNFFAPENIDDYKCVCCGHKENITRTSIMNSSPNTLIVSLNRFTFTNGKAAKLNSRVEFPDILEMPEVKGKYVLTGVIVHQGGSGGGHYFSFVKSPHANFWYTLNDAQVKLHLGFNNVREICYGNGNACLNAYILFYTKV